MSRTAIAAALALDDLGVGQRLVAFSLASFADRDDRARPGTPGAAARAGLKRSWFLEARDKLEHRGLLVVEDAATGRGRASTLRLSFADTGPWWEGEINAELFEVVLSYSRAHGTARLLLAAMAALADPRGVVEGVTTAQLCDAAAISDRTYRRAQAALLALRELHVRGGAGGRGNTNCWEIFDPRTRADEVEPVTRRRVAPPAGQRPLVARVASAQAGVARPGAETGGRLAGEDLQVSGVKGGPERTVSERKRPVTAGVSGRKGGAERTLSPLIRPAGAGVLCEKGGADRTLSRKTPAETPAETPAPNARAGREPQNPRTVNPPSPPEGGSRDDEVVVEETFVTGRGRTRRRPVVVDLGSVRATLEAPGDRDHAAWQQVRSFLRDVVSEDIFEIWFAPLELIAVDRDRRLVVDASMPARSWLHARFGRLIESCASRVGRGVRFADERERLAAMAEWRPTPTSASSEQMWPRANAATGGPRPKEMTHQMQLDRNASHASQAAVSRRVPS